MLAVPVRERTGVGKAFLILNYVLLSFMSWLSGGRLGWEMLELLSKRSKLGEPGGRVTFFNCLLKILLTLKPKLGSFVIIYFLIS